MEKVLKTLDVLKSLSSSDAIPGISTAMITASDSIKTKNERIGCCRTITDALSSKSVQQLKDYGVILENGVEVFFQLASDEDSDIRLAASDSLIELIKVLKEKPYHKLQSEIFKEIKRNLLPKSLKKAIILFAHISHSIRSQKCRVYMASLVPCFQALAKRTEEALFENLDLPMRDIFKNLAPFLTDEEALALRRDFTLNLQSNSGIIRRTSALILVAMAEYSRKPITQLSVLFKELIDILHPNVMQRSNSLIIGTSLCIRRVIETFYGKIRLLESVPWKGIEKFSEEDIASNIIKVYEMSVVLCNHDDVNVITASLETLQQIFHSPLDAVLKMITSPQGIKNSLDCMKITPSADITISPSRRLSSAEDTYLLEGDEDIPTIHTSISTIGVDNPISDEPNLSNASSSELNRHKSDENVSDKKPSADIHNMTEISIGSLHDEKIPLYFCGRFLAYNFLLSGVSGSVNKSLRPDTEVRVSVKVLAMNALANIINICPDVYYLTLPVTGSRDDQRISDIVNYSSHSDPVLRGSLHLISGYIIQSFKKCQIPQELVKKFTLKYFYTLLTEGFVDTSNAVVKCSLAGMAACWKTTWDCAHELEEFDYYLDKLLKPALCSYWVIKIDFIELMTSVNWHSLKLSPELQAQIISLFILYTRQDDPRVRNAASEALVDYIKMEKREESLKACTCDHRLSKELTKDKMCSCKGQVKKITFRFRLVSQALFPLATQLGFKCAIAGFLTTLNKLGVEFPPKSYMEAWGCHEKSPYLLLYMVDLLKSSEIVHDLVAHNDVLSVACKLVVGLRDHGALTKKHLKEFLYVHCLAVIKIYSDVTESSQTSLSKRTGSPQASPVKKLTLRLDSTEKKSNDELANSLYGRSTTLILTSHFKKIEASIKASWEIYKRTIDPISSQKFYCLLQKAFTFLEELTPLLSAIHLGNLMEDIIPLIAGVLHLCPVEATKCTKTMLKLLYKTEAKGATESLEETPNVENIEEFESYCTDFTLKQIKKTETKKTEEKPDLTNFGSYVRQFEPIVINTLKIYTTTSDVKIQMEVLSFLNQLIRLHVNYSLIDSKEVFLGFVIKQIELLKQGDICAPEMLVKDLFEFLFLLTREHKESKRYITLGTIIQLCEGLISSEENPLTHAIPALTVVVFELFLRRIAPPYDIPEAEIDTLRGNVLRMALKLVGVPTILPLLWVIVLGTKSFGSKVMLINYSTDVYKTIVQALSTEQLKVVKVQDLHMLFNIVFQLQLDSFHYGEMVNILDSILKTKVATIPELERVILLLSTVWLSLLKIIKPESVSRSSLLNGRFVLNLLNYFIGYYAKFSNELKETEIIADQLAIFIEEFNCVFESGDYKPLFEEMNLHENSTILINTLDCINCIRLPFRSYIRKSIGFLLCVIDCPHVVIWGKLLTESHLSEDFNFVFGLILGKMCTGNLEGEEEWAIVNHPMGIIENLESHEGKTFLGHLSNSQLEQFLEVLTNYHRNEDKEKEINGMKIVSFLKGLENGFPGKTAVLAMEMFIRTKDTLLRFELASILTSVLVSAVSNLNSIDSKEREFLASASNNEYLRTRYPRVRSLSLQLTDTVDDRNISLDSSKRLLERLPLLIVGNEEIAKTEGIALAKLLGKLPYSKITDILSQSELNYSILSYCFVHLRRTFSLDDLTSEDLLDLLTSDRRAQQMSKCPLGVVILEKTIEIMDSWENIIKSQCVLDAENLEASLNTRTARRYRKNVKAGVFETVETRVASLTFKKKLPFMWTTLSEFLKMKRIILTKNTNSASDNNFIPTTIFTVSFIYMKLVCEEGNSKSFCYDVLEKFMRFAGAAIHDQNFRQFFNTPENALNISTCVSSLVKIVHCIQDIFKLPLLDNENQTYCQRFVPNEAKPNQVFIKLIDDFIFLTNFIFGVCAKKIHLRDSIGDGLKKIVSGLGRCVGINNWILISNLESSYQDIVKQPMHYTHLIPVESLQVEISQLKFYIFKLSFFEIVSKFQFEENWMGFLSIINAYVMDSSQLHFVVAGLKAIAMMLKSSAKVNYLPFDDEFPLAIGNRIDDMMRDREPKIVKSIALPKIKNKVRKVTNNCFKIDVNSILRFLKDLLPQWLLGNQIKIPLIHLSAVVSCLVSLMEYYDEEDDFVWIHSTLVDIYSIVDKDDEVVFDHLIVGIFNSAAKIPLNEDEIGALVRILETCFTSGSSNVRLSGIKGALFYLQAHPESQNILNAIYPYLLKNSELNETLENSENFSIHLWNLLLLCWTHSPSFEIHQKEILDRICTILSPLNDVYLTIRILILKGLRLKYQSLSGRDDVLKNISQLALQSMKSANLSVFFEAVKLFGTIVYIDFKDYYCKTLEPEVSMKIMEIFEHFVQMLKNGVRTRCGIVSSFIPHLVGDFLAPSEIINRVFAEYLSNQQTNPELLVETLSQVFEKARKNEGEGAIIRDWISSNLGNFIANPDVERIMWSLTTFFIGISNDDNIFSLLTLAQIKKRIPQANILFGAAVIDFFRSLSNEQKNGFIELLRKGPFPEGGLNPYKEILDVIEGLTRD